MSDVNIPCEFKADVVRHFFIRVFIELKLLQKTVFESV